MEQKEVIKVYNVIQGPIETTDMPMSDDGYGFVVVATVEQPNGAIKEEEILFDTFDEAFELIRWFKGKIAPYELWGYS